jgi:hypothetical protein
VLQRPEVLHTAGRMLTSTLAGVTSDEQAKGVRAPGAAAPAAP